MSLGHWSDISCDLRNFIEVTIEPVIKLVGVISDTTRATLDANKMQIRLLRRI